MVYLNPNINFSFRKKNSAAAGDCCSQVLQCHFQAVYQIANITTDWGDIVKEKQYYWKLPLRATIQIGSKLI